MATDPKTEAIKCDRGTTPPSRWLRNEYNIKETWRVYDAKSGHIFCFLSPLYGKKLNSSEAISRVLGPSIGVWAYASAELIRWDNLLPGQEEYLWEAL